MPTPRRPGSSSPPRGNHGAPYTGEPADPQASVVTDATLDFFDHYLKGVAGALAHLQARVADPRVARLEQEQ